MQLQNSRDSSGNASCRQATECASRAGPELAGGTAMLDTRSDWMQLALQRIARSLFLRAKLLRSKNRKSQICFVLQLYKGHGHFSCLALYD